MISAMKRSAMNRFGRILLLVLAAEASAAIAMPARADRVIANVNGWDVIRKNPPVGVGHCMLGKGRGASLVYIDLSGDPEKPYRVRGWALPPEARGGGAKRLQATYRIDGTGRPRLVDVSRDFEITFLAPFSIWEAATLELTTSWVPATTLKHDIATSPDARVFRYSLQGLGAAVRWLDGANCR